jgi:DNA helicase-2/ATP-dependent DNA helicase PcrA
VKRLRLAVAGGRKTQSIIDECVAAPGERRILVLTYTQANQDEIRRRLHARAPLDAHVTVQGWFSFLLAHWVRPYVPCLFAECRLRGLNFEGDPGQWAKGKQRFLDKEWRAYKRHLARLALDVNEASTGAVVDRLSRLYDTIYVDEVQDLNGYDLEILDALIDSPISLTLVGDVRQAILQTNVQDPKNKQYKGVKIKKWFDERCSSGRLGLSHKSRTWRCNQSIADFADSIFDETWGFPKTESCNEALTGHDGLFVVAADDAFAYLETYSPLCLRVSANVARGVELPFVNIGVAKGMDVERVLIWPTAGVLDFLKRGTTLEPTPCCSLYVAVTRAQASVAFAVKDLDGLALRVWRPPTRH